MHYLCQFANNGSVNLINQRCVFGMCHRFPCVCVKQSVTIFYIDQKLPQRLFWSCTLLLTIKKNACFSGINLTSEANIAGRNKHHAFSLKHKTMLCFCFRFQLLYFFAIFDRYTRLLARALGDCFGSFYIHHKRQGTSEIGASN